MLFVHDSFEDQYNTYQKKEKKNLVLFLFSFLLLFFNRYHFLNMVCHIIGSSDGTLKLWRGKTCLHTFVGHKGWSFYFYHAVFFLLLHYVVAKCFLDILLYYVCLNFSFYTGHRKYHQN